MDGDGNVDGNQPDGNVIDGQADGNIPAVGVPVVVGPPVVGPPVVNPVPPVGVGMPLPAAAGAVGAAAAVAAPLGAGAIVARIQDPQAAGVSTAIQDIAALNLQLIQLMITNGVIPQNPATNALLEGNRLAYQAGNASRLREQNTRELRPLTRVPLAPYGNENRFANIKMINVPVFKGTSPDTSEVGRWLSRVLGLAQSNRLSFEATINLLIQGSGGSACDYIEQMKDEGRTLHQIVQHLEMRYGALCSVEEARVKCNTMARKDSEFLPEFIDRLRSMAKVACRFTDDEAERRNQIETIVESNIRRVLPSSVRLALEERIVNRNRIGLPAFTAREIESECIDLERKRQERRAELKQSVKKAGRHVHAVPEVAYNSTDSEDSISEESESEEEGIFQLINEVRQQRQRFERKGQQVDQRKIFKKAVRNYNDKFAKRGDYDRNRDRDRDRRKDQHPTARQVVQGDQSIRRPPLINQQGPPERMDNVQNKNVFELLALANCARGQCIQCGMDGHLMARDQCPLKGKMLVDKPCVKCGRGLHNADDCVRTYQQQNIKLTQESSLNEK